MWRGRGEEGGEKWGARGMHRERKEGGMKDGKEERSKVDMDRMRRGERKEEVKGRGERQEGEFS